MKTFKRKLGFSLVEVVVSVGIFAVAIVGIIGLFAPTTKNVAAVADSDNSTRAVAAIQSYLKEKGSTTSGFQELQKTITQNGTNYDFFVSKGGDKVGKTADLLAADRFFEFSLTRNITLSPTADDTNAGYLAFTIKLRWPAYLPNDVAVADSQKSTLIIPAAVTR
jgi:uncharacterized protein (TIGR02598 family)